MRTGRQIAAIAGLAMMDLYRRKDMIAVGALCLALLAPLAVLKPFGVAGANRYMGEISMLMIWVFSMVLALGLAARQFPPEFESRTIFPLLAKPVRRGTIVLGKYCGALAASVSALAVFYLLYGVFTGARGGGWFPEVFWQAFLLHSACLAVACAVTMAGSLVVTPSANLTFSGLLMFGMLFFGMKLPVLAAGQRGFAAWALRAVYAIAPHAEFFDMRQRLIHGWAPVSWGVFAAVALYAAAYSGAFLALANLAFRRRQL